jgi:hypothetical protein
MINVYRMLVGQVMGRDYLRHFAVDIFKWILKTANEFVWLGIDPTGGLW